jgi:hypothetical protein
MSIEDPSKIALAAKRLAEQATQHREPALTESLNLLLESLPQLLP